MISPVVLWTGKTDKFVPGDKSYDARVIVTPDHSVAFEITTRADAMGIPIWEKEVFNKLPDVFFFDILSLKERSGL
jgi:hypothetical protein